jgi:rRNA maturation RNase YbeY
MISFFSETSFNLESPIEVAQWISNYIEAEGYDEGDISYIFCDEEYLLKINKQFLDHDTLTDIISFDNSLGKQIHGEIYISEERVRENALEFNQTFEDELHRVIIHGILHYCGFKDKTDNEKQAMRAQEDLCLNQRDFLRT